MTPPRLTALRARDFRNLAPLDWRPDPGRHLLLGPNGAGKTSLLEAVYVLATTKSFRTPRLADCVRHAADGFELVGEIEGPARTRLAVSWDRDGLTRSVNGGAASLSEHLSVLPVVAWSSGEVEILTGAPTLRRRFLDRGAVGRRPGLLPVLTRYRRALGQKRDLLARGVGGKGGASGTQLLTPWNELLAQAGAELAAARAGYTDVLSAHLAQTLDEAGLPFPPVTLRYRPSPAVSIEGPEALAAALREAAPEEMDRRQPRIGPHRDDLDVLWGGRPVKEVASAGERKSLSLLLTAAQARVLTASGRRPVLLLDDLDAELAPDTLERVWPVLWDAETGDGQLVATSNRRPVWEGLAVDHRWDVSDGVLKPA